jgi:predicted Fe-S protein YdhL (DUF1289 family)
LTQATTKSGPCQMRSKTESPCLHRAVAEIRGIPLCEGCAREQEVYFAIGELTQGKEGLCSGALGKTLVETLERVWQPRTYDLGTVRRLGLPRVEATERLTLTKSQAEPNRDLLVPRSC